MDSGFPDERLVSRADILYKRTVATGSVVLKRVGGTRTGEIAAHRFLDNENGRHKPFLTHSYSAPWKPARTSVSCPCKIWLTSILRGVMASVKIWKLQQETIVSAFLFTPNYPLDEILLLTLCGVLCGADGCVEISELGEHKLPFLRCFFPFANAIPSDDQLRYIFRHLDPEQFQSCFMRAECSQRPKEPVESSAISVIRSIGLTFS